VEGFKDIYKKSVMHRDVKLANILVHLPLEDLTFRDVKNLEERKALINARLKEINLVASNI